MLLSTLGACYSPDVQAPATSLLPLVFPLVCFCFSPGHPFCGGFALSSQIWCRIGRPLDQFFFFSYRSQSGFWVMVFVDFVLFCFFSGCFCLPLFGDFFPSVCFSKGVASTAHHPLRVFYVPTLLHATIVTLLGGSQPASVRASRWLFMFLFLFSSIRFVFVFLVFSVSAAQPISSAPISPPFIHCRAFPHDPSATSP